MNLILSKPLFTFVDIIKIHFLISTDLQMAYFMFGWQCY